MLGLFPAVTLCLGGGLGGGIIPLLALMFSDGNALQFSDGSYLEFSA